MFLVDVQNVDPVDHVAKSLTKHDDAVGNHDG